MNNADDPTKAPDWHRENKGRAANTFNQQADKAALEAHIDGKPASAMQGHLLKEEGKINFNRDHSNQNAKPDTDRTPPKAPQPVLTPKGAMRNMVDAKVREKQEAIKAKMAQDKHLSRDR